MITLINNFHNTEARIRAKVGDKIPDRTVNRVRFKLCGIKDCKCSGVTGVRGGKYRISAGEYGDYILTEATGN